MTRALVCVVYLACGVAHAAHLADTESGLPLIQSIVPALFDSPGTPVGTQAFDIERVADGALLVANNEGLLRLDGTGWRTWNPLRGAVLAVAARGDGRVFVGGVGDFGYFDRFGGDFISLKPWSERVDRRFGEIWAIVVGPVATHFVDRERVYRWDDERLTLVYEGRGELRQGVLLGDAALVFDPAVGLVLLGDGASQVLTGSEALAHLDSCALATVGAHAATVCSDGTVRTWSAHGMERNVRVDATLARQLAEARISALTSVAPEAFAVGTRRGGLFLLGSDGGSLGNLSQVAERDDARIFSLLALGVDGLWMGRDHGLALMEWPGQVSRYDPGIGLPRVPLGVARLNGVLHIVTTRGIFRLVPSGNGFAAAVPHALSENVVFDFATSSDTLFASTREGLFTVDTEGSVLVDSRLSYVALVIGETPTRLLVGGERSAWVIERDAAGWRALGDLPGVRAEIRRIVVESPGVVWLASRSARQLLRVALGSLAAPDWSPAGAQVDDFSNSPDAPQGPVQPLAVLDGLAFASLDGIYRYEPAQRRFRPDAALNALLPAARGTLRESLILDNERVLFAQHDRYRVLRQHPEGWIDETTPLARIPRGATPRSLYREADGTLWISTSDAVYRHRPAAQSQLPSLPPPRIDLIDGDGTPTPLGTGTEVSLGTAPMALSFRFSVAVLVAAEQLRFRTRLVPLDRGWGTWTSSAARELAYVPGGDYVLEVQAQDVFDRISATTRVGLHIDTPWFLREWALAVYGALSLAAIALLVRLRERSLRARAAALEVLVRERTSALEAASVTDQLTGLHNRRFFELAAQSLRNERHGVLVALIDIDHFKRINDTHGHETGDRVLQFVAARLVDAAPQGAVLFRWGGEEFLLLAPLRAGGEGAAEVMGRVLDRVGATPIGLGAVGAVSVGCSIGWEVSASVDHVPLRDALRRADAHLYAAKQGGRDRACGPGGETRVRVAR